MIEDDPSLTAPTAQLFRFALGSQIRLWFAEQLGDWMPAAQDDVACVRVLGGWCLSRGGHPAERLAAG
jgi:hypothetical protein